MTFVNKGGLRRIADMTIQPHQARWEQIPETGEPLQWTEKFSRPLGFLIADEFDHITGSPAAFYNYQQGATPEIVDAKAVFASWRNQDGQTLELKADRIYHIAGRHLGNPGKPGNFFNDLGVLAAARLFAAHSTQPLPQGLHFFETGVDTGQTTGWTTRLTARQMIEAGTLDADDWQGARAFEDTVYKANLTGTAASNKELAKRLSGDMQGTNIKFITRGNTDCLKIVPFVVLQEVPTTTGIGAVIGINGRIDDLRGNIVTMYPREVHSALPFAMEFLSHQLERKIGSVTLAELQRKSEQGAPLDSDQEEALGRYRKAHDNAWDAPLVGLSGDVDKTKSRQKAKRQSS